MLLSEVKKRVESYEYHAHRLGINLDDVEFYSAHDEPVVYSNHYDLNRAVEGELDPVPARWCGFRHHHHSCTCNGEGGDR